MLRLSYPPVSVPALPREWIPMTNKTICASVALLLVLSASGVRAADWPSWGGADPGRNMVSSETGLPDSFKPGEKSPKGDGILPSTTENVRWVVKLGAHICGNPTVAAGRVYIGTDDANLQDDKRFKRTRGGMVWCLDEKTGAPLWRLPTPARSKERLPKDAHYTQQYMGVCSSPAVSGDRVYVMTNGCEILCLDAQGQANGNDGSFQEESRYIAGAGNNPVPVQKSDGDILWKFDLIDQLDICPHDVAANSVLIDGDILYCVSANGVDKLHEKCLRPDAPSFIALDARTGKLLATDTENIGRRMWHCLWSSPTLGVVNGEKLVFFGGPEGFCYAFQALSEIPSRPVHLKKVWSYDCVPPNYRDPLGDGKPFNYYIGDKRKRISTNKNDGEFLGPSEIIASPVFHQGSVYCAIGQDPMHGRGRGMLHRIDASQTGEVTRSARLWTYDALERTVGSVAIHDGLLLASDLSGKVHCLDVATGKPHWVYQIQAESWSTPLIADGKVYINTAKKLVVLAAARESKLLSEIPLGSAAYAAPIAANGTVYICSQSYLWAVQQGASPAPRPLAAER